MTTHDPQPFYAHGKKLLDSTGWKTDPSAMFRCPSLAKGTELRRVCEGYAVDQGLDVATVIEIVLLTARMDHVISIGGQRAREYLLSSACPLDGKRIARLCRRMPPFIQAKLTELYAGGQDVDSNPTDAFDTNGWSELSSRLPRFAVIIHRVANALDDETELLKLGDEDMRRLVAIVQNVSAEAEALNDLVDQHEPEGVPGRVDDMSSRSSVDWRHAFTKLSQLQGALRKCRRDLQSPHWKPEWVPTAAQ